MSDALKDQNYVLTKLGVLFSDGVTLVPIKINSSDNGMEVNTTDTVDSSILALYLAGKAIPRDANGVPAWCGEADDSSGAVLPVFVDSDGSVLIDL